MKRSVKEAWLAALRYPASPRLGEHSDCPSFCWRPEECQGNGSCRRNPSCCD